MAKALADVKIRSLAVLGGAGVSIIDHVFSQVAARGAPVAIAIREMAEPSEARKQKKCDFIEVNIPPEPERRSIHSDGGAFLCPQQEKANCFPEVARCSHCLAPFPPPLRSNPVGYSAASRRGPA